MKVKMCPDEDVGLIFGDKHFWCTGKLPCGRCISIRYGNRGVCGRDKLIDTVLQCELCEARFICFTAAPDITPAFNREVYEYNQEIQRIVKLALGVE